MTSGSNCDFKQLTSGRALGKLRRKTAAPVDMMFFNHDVPYHGTLGNRNIHHGTALPLKNTNNIEMHHTEGYPLVGILVGIAPYFRAVKNLPGANHAIGAVKYRDTLYVCDPLGKDREVNLVNTILNQLVTHYECRRSVLYKGPSLQTADSCVGYSSNFIATLLQYFQKGGSNFNQAYYNREMHRTLSSNVGMVFGQGNEPSILRSLEKRSIPKVATRSKPSAKGARTLKPVKGRVTKYKE